MRSEGASGVKHFSDDMQKKLIPLDSGKLRMFLISRIHTKKNTNSYKTYKLLEKRWNWKK